MCRHPRLRGLQDAGCKLRLPLPKGTVVTYHTHGFRQFYGTAKLHRRLDCPVLTNWKAWTGSVTVMRETLERPALPSETCRRCWNKPPMPVEIREVPSGQFSALSWCPDCKEYCVEKVS